MRTSPPSAPRNITLTLIENYLDFKVGEVWEEVMQELIADNITPIKTDREALKQIKDIVFAKSEAVRRNQLNILEAEQQNELDEEKKCYIQIKSNFRQKEQQNASRIDFINKTSDYETLQISKQRQSALAERSRTAVTGDPGIEHNTLLKMLTSTVHSGRHINVPLSDSPISIKSPFRPLPSINTIK